MGVSIGRGTNQQPKTYSLPWSLLVVDCVVCLTLTLTWNKLLEFFIMWLIIQIFWKGTFIQLTECIHT